MLFYVCVVLVAAVLIVVLSVPVVIWWLMADIPQGDVELPARPHPFSKAAVWRAFTAWQARRPLQLTHRR